MGNVLRIFLTFLAGLFITYIAVVAAGVAYMDITHYFDREGAASMGLIFMVGPACGIIGGIAAAILMARRIKRRKAPDPT